MKTHGSESRGHARSGASRDRLETYRLRVSIVSRGQTSFLALSVIAFSISAQPKKVWSGLYTQVVLTPPC